MREEGRKVWHAMDAKNSKYFLVNVLPHNKSSSSTPISFQGEKSQVLSDELLQYDPEKKGKLSALTFVNQAEILDWVEQNGGEEGWVKLTPKLVLDFGTKTEGIRQKHLQFIINRFLVSVAASEFIVVSNDKLTKSSSCTIHQDLLKAIASTHHLWPYPVPLSTLTQLYSAFFLGSALKFKMYIQKTSIIKIGIDPFLLGSREILGTPSSTGTSKLDLHPKIFSILGKSNSQMKRYFKIPQTASVNNSEVQVGALVDWFLALGLRIPQINSIVHAFVIIMNLNEAEVIKYQRKEGQVFKIKKTSQQWQNLSVLLEQQLFQLLQKDINKFPDQKDHTPENITTKLIILMEIIWKQAIIYVANWINTKLVNLQTDFSKDVRKLVFIQFPAVSENFRDSVENANLLHIHNLIKNIALRLQKADKYVKGDLWKKIVEESSYDFNKHLLKDLEHQEKWSEQLKNGPFMKQFREKHFMKIEGAKKNNMHVSQQLETIHKEASRNSVNFIIRSQFNNSNKVSKSLLLELRQSIEEERKKNQKNMEQKKMEAQFVDYDYVQSDMLNDEDVEYIPISMANFEDRYRYCSLKKDIKKNAKFSEKFMVIAKDSKGRCLAKARAEGSEYVVYLSENYFCDLQNQVLQYDTVANKIKRQIRQKLLRNDILKKLHQLNVKIRFQKWFYSRTHPHLKASFAQLRHRTAAMKIQDAMFQYFVNLERINFKKIRKVAAVRKLRQLEDRLKQKQKKTLQKGWFYNARQSYNKKRKTQAANFIHEMTLALKQDRQQQFLFRLEIISKWKRQQESAQNFSKILDRVVQKNIENTYFQIKSFAEEKNKEEEQLRNEKLQRKKQQEKMKQQEKKAQRLLDQEQKNKSQKKEEKQPQEKQQKMLQEKPQEKSQEIPQEKPQEKQQQQNPQGNERAQNDRVESRPPAVEGEPIITVTQPSQSQLANASNAPKDNPKVQQIQRKNSISKSEKSDMESRSYAHSSNFGNQRSQQIISLTKDQLMSLKDKPKFSFQNWMKEAVGFQKKKPEQKQKKAPIQKLFNKVQLQRPPNRQPESELDVDILIKEKVVVNPFFPYLVQHVGGSTEQDIQKKVSHQSSIIKEPLLQKYEMKKYNRLPQQIFNNLLKLGKDKNSSKSKLQLINQIVKPMRQSYFFQKKNITNVIEGQPALIIDYSWEHNILKDQVFLLIIKQLMNNQDQDSLRELFDVMEILTRYFYPSPQFLYSFIHYLKSLQSKKFQKIEEAFKNTLLFAQAYEKFKGNNVTVMEQQIPPKQKQSYLQLESRITSLTEPQITGMLTVTVRLFNDQKFQYKVRNETLSFFRRKLLKDIDFLQYEQYFGIYLVQAKGGKMGILNEFIKTVDFLNQYPQSQNQNILYVKLKYFFPFSLKELNKVRLFYLTAVPEEKNLPWKKEQYQQICALSMIFDEFQEYRITNFLKISGHNKNQELDLGPIQAKYTKMTTSKGQKVSEIEYFKILKDCGFLGAKGYLMKQASLFHTKAVSRIVIKPLQLCLYDGHQIRASIDLRRIKYFLLDKGNIYMDIEYNQKGLIGMRSMTLKGVDRVSQLYQDLLAYTQYLSDK